MTVEGGRLERAVRPECGIVAGSDPETYNRLMGASPSSNATLTIRRLDGLLKERLRVRAARNGRSMQAEARSILAATLVAEDGGEPDLAEAIRRRVAALGGIELEPHPPVPVRDPTRLGE